MVANTVVMGRYLADWLSQAEIVIKMEFSFDKLKKKTALMILSNNGYRSTNETFRPRTFSVSANIEQWRQWLE